MSRFTLTNIPYEPPQPRDATVIAAIFDAYETASAALDESNFAEEGITKRTVEDDALQAYVGHTAVIVDTTFAVPFAAVGTLVLNGTSMQVNLGAAGTIGANEAIRITSFLDVKWDPGAIAGLETVELRFDHAHSPTGGAAVKVLGSRWHRRFRYGAGPNGYSLGAPPYPLQGQHACVMMESWVFGPTGNSSGFVTLRREFLSSSALATVTVRNGILVVDKFKQIERLS